MLALINYRLRVTLNDSRTLTGQMLAFDRHLNLVLADCEEFRFIKQKKKKGPSANSTNAEESEELEMKRALGLVILRGETIVSLSVEGPPPAVADEKGPTIAPGRGAGVPAGRGVGLPPPPGAPPPMMRGQPMSFPRPGGPPPGMAPTWHGHATATRLILHHENQPSYFLLMKLIVFISASDRDLQVSTHGEARPSWVIMHHQASVLPVKVPHLASTVDNLTSSLAFAIMLVVARSFLAEFVF
ncbi:hypothetical protein PSHT_12552 [Puccinia striiformis]|uniref:Sm protein B n=1 Tax=Puccinia striiformis TaxID=27350 RepID=A0A2S4UVZ6_9BASI|nr:hypothetical protein PSHT_12552 [Puccinia striiformis]